MPSNYKEFTFRNLLTHCNNWSFQIYLFATLFIVFFSVSAIHNWSPLYKHICILLACLLPTGIAISSEVPAWRKANYLPKEVLWVVIVAILGVISSISNKNPIGNLKSTVLFIASGPLIYLSSRFLLKSKENQDKFLKAIVPILLIAGILGIYEYYYATQIRIFSGNPLPAGALLLLLSSSPLILLKREVSYPLKAASIFSLVLVGLLIILLAKKGPILAIVFSLLFSVLIISRKYIYFFIGFLLMAGLVLYISDSTRKEFMESVGLHIIPPPKAKASPPGKAELSSPKSSNSKYRFEPYLSSSIRIRLENYFFAMHVFKNNPIWGTGFKNSLVPYLEDYNQKFVYELGPLRYEQHFTSEYTFENIVLAFLVESGSFFTITYFGGVLYLMVMCFKKLLISSTNGYSGMMIMSVFIGFAFLSLTFDTLRFPNLNWMFHSFLGLMANLADPPSVKA